MKTRFLIISVGLALIFSTSQAFGCTKKVGIDVLLPWFEIMSGDCSILSYSISLSGIIYVVLGIASVIIWKKRK